MQYFGLYHAEKDEFTFITHAFSVSDFLGWLRRYTDVSDSVPDEDLIQTCANQGLDIKPCRVELLQ